MQWRYVLWGGALAGTVAAYWLVRPLKVAVLMGVDGGVTREPQAKLCTMAFLFPVLHLYNTGVSSLSLSRLVAVVAAAQIAIFSALALVLVPAAATGSLAAAYAAYALIESVGSLTVTMMWSCISCGIHAEKALVVYPRLTVTQQLGALAASYAASCLADAYQSPSVLVAAGGAAAIAGTASALAALAASPASLAAENLDELRASDTASETSEEDGRAHARAAAAAAAGAGKRNPGALELLATYGSFIAHMTIISCASDVLMAASAAYETPAAMAAFVASVGTVINVATLAVSLAGPGPIVRAVGLRTALLAFPLVAMAVVWAVALASSPVLALAFAVVVLKTCKYALNTPAKELIYVQARPEVKLAVKPWIDAVGGRSAKGFGSLANTALLAIAPSGVQLHWLSSAACSAVAVVWAWSAAHVHSWSAGA
ncbi:uncharacterized protein AMSG_03115 [Thecamonas trahens ATCC 50062]|uniref:ADP,ATP carrier protein n=1 Tax=Thecamonas trahens ATCC 50062 TaxID=461836 RepID=A0A0L0D2X7_THETB|nr:hypothetical protein AMSG_03115 [Thecamonas trahens ATCC 50062]KNC46677.1 hypothetical protein AMSG_03115 [Thecamonas trahens ATCC 50062]|eukprot:XP_013760447.1 hypothetical protein AMSG_03115 [Thecamonas trahens ATCC 50062]